jgi:hypothetical protein
MFLLAPDHDLGSCYDVLFRQFGDLSHVCVISKLRNKLGNTRVVSVNKKTTADHVART